MKAVPTVDASNGADDELEVLYHGPGHCACGRLGNMSLQVWFAAAREVDALALAAIADDLTSRYPRGISSVHWLPGALQVPAAAPRRIFTNVLKRHGPSIGEVAMIVDGEGFWVGAVRSMLIGIRAAAGAKANFRVGRSLDECLTWLPDEHARRTGVQLHPSRLRRAFESLRTAHEPPP